MTFIQAAQNMLLFCLPVAVYALVQRRRSRLAPFEIGHRLGLELGPGRYYAIALAAALPISLLVIRISSLTSSFKGSMLAPFVGASPTPEIVGRVIAYGVIATGFPEELLFRGLIAGIFFRRCSFWKANALQSGVFMLPHLLILLIAPRLWPLAIFLPLVHGLIAGWLRQSSGSIGPSIILHAIPNAVGALAVMRWGP
jgi:uncharacterized protein